VWQISFSLRLLNKWNFWSVQPQVITCRDGSQVLVFFIFLHLTSVRIIGTHILVCCTYKTAVCAKIFIILSSTRAVCERLVHRCSTDRYLYFITLLAIFVDWFLWNLITAVPDESCIQSGFHILPIKFFMHSKYRHTQCYFYIFACMHLKYEYLLRVLRIFYWAFFSFITSRCF
jgi:hypothetical protein